MAPAQQVDSFIDEDDQSWYVRSTAGYPALLTHAAHYVWRNSTFQIGISDHAPAVIRYDSLSPSQKTFKIIVLSLRAMEYDELVHSSSY